LYPPLYDSKKMENGKKKIIKEERVCVKKSEESVKSDKIEIDTKGKTGDNKDV